MIEKNNFDSLKSKIRELHIPLPNFKYFHKPSSEEEVFENFIGQEENSEQLENWLTNDETGGAYLVTGYRGMGKSSFVGKVLNKITEDTEKSIFKKGFFTKITRINFIFNLCCSLSIFCLILVVFIPLCIEKNFWWLLPLGLLIILLVIIGPIIVDSYTSKNQKHKKHKTEFKKKGIKEKDYKSHKTWFEKVFEIKNNKEDRHNLVIKLNLGHETLKEKDILSLVAKRIYDTYKDYLNNFYTNGVRLFIKNCILFGGAIFIVWFLGHIKIYEIINIDIDKCPNKISDLFLVIKNLTYKLISTKIAIIVTKLVLLVVFYFVVKRLYNFVMSKISLFSNRSSRVTLEKLKFLIDRIESSVTESSGPNTGYTPSTSIFSFNFSRRKNKTYPYASVRDIEDELIQTLYRIKRTHPYKPPKFIIVFDELDKIDPVYNQVIKTEQDIPEFEAGVDFQGGSAIRNRKKNILKLLGNMKLFMSQAKAKFVFIAGRELYDAFLADLADREFAASSIFNGVIYVDSFLDSSSKEKNILTKTEEYICGYLIPKEWYIDEAQRRFKEEKGIKELNNPKIDLEILSKKLENITYRNPNLRMYKKFLIETLILKVGETVKFESYRDLKNTCKDDEEILKKIKIKDFINAVSQLDKSSSEDEISKIFDKHLYFAQSIKENIVNYYFNNNIPLSKDEINKKINELYNWHFGCISLSDEEKNNILSEIEQIHLFIDKVIVFLNQFSFYLTHVCNGSPKKITIYFEKYINPFIYEHEKNPFSKCNHEHIIKSEHCLHFDANDQQKIGFIYYIAYPIVQTIINNASHFGDKMLVSNSFLIDHILKHHKGGFSYEDIEHTPELLEVYHIPNIRDAIDAIFAFLRQNIVTDICGGVYQYKFRKFIADEIKYNSHVSEEISAIFNFTLDESLPVKRHYYKQIKDSEKKYFAIEESIEGKLVKNQYAITLASQLEVLAEIHLLDDEYNEAIQYYQTAFEIIKSELRGCEKGKDIDTDRFCTLPLFKNTYPAKGKDIDTDRLHLHVLLNHTVLKLGLAKEFKGAYNEAFVIYNTLLDYLVKFRYLDEKILGLEYYYEDNLLNNENIGEWKTKKMRFYHDIDRNTNTIKNYKEDKFYSAEVLPFYQEMDTIKIKKIDFLLDGDYTLSGLSKVLSPEKQEIISRITLFTEVKFIYQVILANLFVVEKIDLNGITQENLDLAEDQFKYMYLLTDSKDKFIQAADFYKKVASILFLKNYSNPKPDEYLQMWGFDIYETINEFCFIRSEKHSHIQKTYGERIVNKYPKEILWEFFVGNYDNLWKIFIDERNIELIKLIKQDIPNIKNNILEIPEIQKIANEQEHELIVDFVLFGIKKWQDFFQEEDLKKCKECYSNCIKREKNHPCYACSYVSYSLRIFIKVFTPKYDKLLKIERSNEAYKKGKSYLLKLLEYFEKVQTNSNNFFVLASALRIKADISLSCISESENRLDKEKFLEPFLDFLENYYDYQHGDKNPNNIDAFINNYIEKGNLSKLEKTILYYWLAAEYFHLNTSPIDSSECLTKILLIFDNYITIKKELNILDHQNYGNPFENDSDIFYKIRNTIVRRVLRNTNITNDDVNYIELQNLKYILRSRPTMHINLSNLSTTASIEEVLFAYCKFELNSIDIKDGKKTVSFDCYQSTLLSSNRLSSTIQGKILSLEFKAKMNMAIFESIFNQVKDRKMELLSEFKSKISIPCKYSNFVIKYLDSIPEKINFYGCDFQITYFWFLKNYLSKKFKINIFSILENYENNMNTKIRLFQFLISDSLYCLTQIIEILSSGKFSKFSHSFIGDIYHQISQWATLYQLTNHILPQYTENKRDIEIFIDKEINTMKRRHKDIEGKDISNGDFKLFFDNVKYIKKIFEDQQSSITSKVFESNILDDIGTGNRRFLVPNYSIAMALRHYRKATEVHHEGKEYKEMIKKMYIIDDDISNGMHNFALALERYTLNSELIEKKMEFLRKYYKDSLSYPLENYLKDTSKYL